ncbi:MAG: hypothetical protein JWM11_3435 [Planctomycetaceae bacterium]|nr:hypothetical protein [Planctomycetaceae bacterium]
MSRKEYMTLCLGCSSIQESLFSSVFYSEALGTNKIDSGDNHRDLPCIITVSRSRESSGESPKATEFPRFIRRKVQVGFSKTDTRKATLVEQRVHDAISGRIQDGAALLCARRTCHEWPTCFRGLFQRLQFKGRRQIDGILDFAGGRSDGLGKISTATMLACRLLQ